MVPPDKNSSTLEYPCDSLSMDRNPTEQFGKEGNRRSRLSVVMPVRNAAKFLDESIGSICEQTYADFEFAIVNDCSTDDSLAVIQAWAARDPRIFVVDSPVHLGPAQAANLAVRSTSGNLVARMDADDYSAPHRFEKQLRIFAEQPGTVLVGSIVRLVDEQGNLLVAEDHRALTTRFRSHQAAHGSWIFQRQVFERIGGYREATNYWEDGDAFIRFAEAGPIRIVPEVLYTYRFHTNNARSHITAGQRELWSKSTTEARPNLGLSIPPAIYSNAHWLGKRAPLIRRLFITRLWPTSPALLVVWLFAMFAGSFPRPYRYVHCMAINLGAALSRNKHAKMTAVVWKAAPRLWTGTR